MPIENRELAAGTRLVARYKKQDRTCEVVETAEGLRYRLDNGTEHKSPSSAGKAAMDGVACNGWRFWSVAGTEPAKREPKAKTDKPTKERKTLRRPTVNESQKRSGSRLPDFIGGGPARVQCFTTVDEVREHHGFSNT